MVRRKGMGKGKGKGYKNIMGKDPLVHSQSARGMKQPQKVQIPNFNFKPISMLKPSWMGQRRDLIIKYVPQWSNKYGEIKNDGFLRIENVPLNVAQNLMTGYPNANISDTHNESPSHKKMLEYIKKYGGTLEGYVTEPSREDARIQFDGFTLNVSDAEAKRLKKQLKPDEFEKKVNKYRFWWD